MKPRDTKIKTAKILTVEILASNIDRAIEHVSGSGEQVMVFLAFERPSRLQWTRLHPLACYRRFQVGCPKNSECKTAKVSRDLNPPIESKLSRDNLDSIGGFKSRDTFAVLHSKFLGQPT